MIFKTKQAAQLSLLEFSPAMRRLHRIIPATVDGQPAGWMRQLVTKKKE